jgi:hypothetical protein
MLAASVLLSVFLATSASALDSQADSLAKNIRRLREITVSTYETTIPDQARPLLSSLRPEFGRLILSTLNSAASKQSALDVVQKAVLRRLENEKIVIEKPDEDEEMEAARRQPYGKLYGVLLDQLQPDLIAATVKMSVNCGEDNSLYIFQLTSSGWDLRLEYGADSYVNIDAAFEQFGYRVSRRKTDGDLLVGVAHITPWCFSNWRKIHYAILKIEDRADRPEAILNRSDAIFLGVEPVYTLKFEGDRFSVSFYGGEDLNPDGTPPLKVDEFLVSNHSVKPLK